LKLELEKIQPLRPRLENNLLVQFGEAPKKTETLGANAINYGLFAVIYGTQLSRK
jgi:hypothetical protein